MKNRYSLFGKDLDATLDKLEAKGWYIVFEDDYEHIYVLQKDTEQGYAEMTIKYTCNDNDDWIVHTAKVAYHR